MSPVSETCSHSVAIAVKGYEGLLNFVWFGLCTRVYNMPSHIILCHAIGHGACWMQQIPLAKGVAQSSKNLHPVLRKE